MLENGTDLSIIDKVVKKKARHFSFSLKTTPLCNAGTSETRPTQTTPARNCISYTVHSAIPLQLQLENLLGNTDPSNNSNVISALNEIKTSCHLFKNDATAPCGFSITVGTEELAFNNTVLVDTMFI